MQHSQDAYPPDDVISPIHGLKSGGKHCANLNSLSPLETEVQLDRLTSSGSRIMAATVNTMKNMCVKMSNKSKLRVAILPYLVFKTSLGKRRKIISGGGKLGTKVRWMEWSIIGRDPLLWLRHLENRDDMDLGLKFPGVSSL